MRYLILLLLPIISACSVLEKKSVEVVKQEIAIPSSLLQPCIPDAPMEQDAYAKLTSHEREIELGLYTIHLFEVIASCNAKLTSVKTMVEQFDALHSVRRSSNESE